MIFATTTFRCDDESKYFKRIIILGIHLKTCTATGYTMFSYIIYTYYFDLALRKRRSL